MELATVEEATAAVAAAAAAASSLVGHHEESLLKQPNYTTSSLLPTASHHFSNTSSYLPDLLPIQAHDVMLQQHQHDTNNLFSTAAHAAIGQHMLEGLQPIRKEEM